MSHNRLKQVKQSLFFPILMGVISIIFTILILVGWSIIFTRYYMLSTKTRLLSEVGIGYWLMLWIGYFFLVSIVTALVIFLISNVRQKLYLREQTSFIDSVTHELKSPLASLRLCLETMEMRDLSPTVQQKFLDMMKKDTDRLTTFIEHILEAGRTDYHEREFNYESTNIEKITTRNINQISQRYHLPKNSISLHLDAMIREYPIVTATVALDTILLNLLDNAVKYSPNKVSIELHVYPQNDLLHIEVRDHGMGIPRGQLKKIFRRFYRIHRQKQNNVRGTGLGLYVVASFVKRLGGRISASSLGENQGSAFLVELPLVMQSTNQKIP